MTKPIVFMFSGQGSQYHHMARDLYDTNPIFRDWMHKLDQIAYEICGRSIISFLYNDAKRKIDLFDNIKFTHPSIFMVEYALARMLLELDVIPNYVMGASMGEITSAAIAGVMDYEDAMDAILYHASVMEACCRQGGMTAIIDDVSLYEKETVICENSELSSINFNSHFVVSAGTDELDLIANHLKRQEILYQPLPVRYAFHSAFMDPAESDYVTYLRRKPCNTPEIPIVSCVTSTILNQLETDYFWNATCKPVLFKDTIDMMEKYGNYIYLDLGPSGTLSTFTKYNLPENSKSEIYDTITPFGHEMKKLEKIVTVCCHYPER